MKQTTTIMLLLVLLAVFVWADNDQTYTATVGNVSNIIITTNDTSFDSCVVGASCNPIDESLRVENLGNVIPSSHITGVFLTNNVTYYGLNLTVGANNIPGNNFALNGVSFTNSASTVVVEQNSTLTPGYDQYWNATLDIPAGQAEGSYSGTIRLSWTA